MEPAGLSDPSHDDVIEFAQQVKTDKRITSIVPKFDVPFFQAGLAGYSDGAMRLIARRNGCPYCITEALLDVTLINGGKGRRREDPDLLAEECGTGEVDENRAAGLDDHPIAGQVMGTSPETMGQGAAILVELGERALQDAMLPRVCRGAGKECIPHLLLKPVDGLPLLHGRQIHL